MNGLHTANAPSSSIVIPHFIAAGVFFFIAVLLLLFSADALLDNYHDDRLIAITHLLLLGWGSMMIFGALYQLIPVVYDTSLYSDLLAILTFILLTVSVPFLAYSFWTGSYAGMLFYASIAAFVSLLLFIINLYMTYRKSRKKNIQSRFITSSVFWLAATEIMGLTLALNFRYGFLSAPHLHYLKIHAHLGLAGWFLLLIMGAASILIPMFMVSHRQDDKKLHYTFYLVNGGLLLLIGDWLWFPYSIGVYTGALSIMTGIFFFLNQMYIAYKNRLRKKLDKGLQYTRNSLRALIPAVISALVLLIAGKPSSQWVTIYGIFIFLGFISALILGQTYKTLPFIIWLEKYQQYVGKYKTPLPAELYNHLIVKIQFHVYYSGVTVLLAGVIFHSKYLLITGGTLLIIASVLHVINVLIMLFHPIRLEEIKHN